MRIVAVLLVALLAGAAFADTTYVTIGSPVAPNVIPFWGQNYLSFRLQWLYFASEIGRSGDIASFDLWGANNLAAEYYNVRVSFCHTGLGELYNEFDRNYDGNTPVEVLSADTLTVGYGEPTHWYRFPAGFQYDGTSNLLIEIRWNGSAGTNVAFWRNGLGHIHRRIFAYEHDARFGSSDTVMCNYIRFGFLPTGQQEPDPRPEPSGFGPVSTVVRGGLYLSPAGMGDDRVPMTLLDASGRRVMALVPGENDVRHLAPGVYFVRAEAARSPGAEAVSRKVIIQR